MTSAGTEIATPRIAIPPGETAQSGWSARNVYILIVLLLTYVVNYVDRQILAALATQIKAEFDLSDTQLGLLGGLAFALLYTTVGIPVAWLADRTNRAKIIAIACAAWSLATATCGMAQNFAQLFVARMAVSVGETGCVAPSLALISDIFPPRLRSRAYAVFYIGIPLGSALGIFFGGWIAANVNWRAAFVVVGLAGLPLAALIHWTIPDPARGRHIADTPNAEARPRAGVVARRLITTPNFWLVSVGSACSAVLMYGLIFWLPSLLQRSFGLTLIEASWFFGSVVLIGGGLGTWTGGWIADKLGPARPEAYAAAPAIALLLAGPVYAMAIFSSNLTAAFLLFTLGQVLGLVGASPLATIIQHIVPATMRATAVASFLFITNVLGLGFGTFVLGVMSDMMTEQYGNEALRYSLLYGLVFYLLGAIVLVPAALRMRKDWIG